MPPRPFLGVVIDRQFPLALRAGEASSPRMLRPHIHPTIGHRQLDPAHLPRGDQTQQMPVQLGVTHPGIMPRDRLITTRKPTEKPEAPFSGPGWGWPELITTSRSDPGPRSAPAPSLGPIDAPTNAEAVHPGLAQV